MGGVSTNDAAPTADALRSRRLAALNLQILRLRYSIALGAYHALVAENGEQKNSTAAENRRPEEARALETLEKVRRELRAAVAADTPWSLRRKPS